MTLLSKLRSKKIYRFLFGIKYFTRKEVNELKTLYVDRNFDQYSYRVFAIVKKNNPNRFTVIDDDYYYNRLSQISADIIRRFEDQIKPNSHYNFQNRFLTDYISIETILIHVEEAYGGHNNS